MTQLEEFLVACLIPWVVQRHGCIEWLEERVKEPKNERQKINLLALIRMGDSGHLRLVIQSLSAMERLWISHLAARTFLPQSLLYGLRLVYILAF